MKWFRVPCLRCQSVMQVGLPSTLSAIVLGNPGWSWVPVVSAVIALALLAIGYSSVQRPALWKLSLASLKVLAVLLIAACLLNPMWTRETLQPGENLVLIVADNSASLNIRADGLTRGEQLREVLKSQNLDSEAQPPRSDWQSALAENFTIRRYQFGDRLSAVDNFEQLTFSDSASHLTATMSHLQERYADQPVAAILLLTDGIATDVNDTAVAPATTSHFPIYPVTWTTETDEMPDVRIQKVAVSQTAFEDAPVTVNVTVVAEHLTEANVIVSIEPHNIQAESADDGESAEPTDGLQSQTVACHSDLPTPVRFQLRPERAGMSYYRIRVTPVNEPDAFENPEQSTEVTLANNERFVAIDRGDKTHRVLYVGGRPNWEYKFINRALLEDEAVNMVSLIRIARKEAKFDFRGRAGESTNSLFRGFKDDADEETEAYDEAVVIRLNAKDKSELTGGFPKKKADLYPYKAIILDDVEAAFFTHDQLELLDRFVSERGGGLLMLGGRDSYRHGEWHRSPLKDALPVYLDRVGQKPSGRVQWDLTREGWLEPWMRLRETEDADKARLSTMPPFAIINATQELKPGARLLASVQDETGATLPSLAIQQYGKGRTGAVLIGDLWRWSLQREEGAEDDLAQAWRQTVRWLVADVPRPVETSLAWVQLGQTPAVKLQVMVRDDEFQPQNNAAVALSIQQPDATTLKLNAEPSLEEPGLFEAIYVPRSAGAFQADISVTNEEGIAAGTASMGWTHDPAAEEFQQVNINQQALQRLAEESGGTLLTHDELAKFVDDLPQTELPVMKTETTPLWHTPWLLIIAISSLAGEWGLRRWRGLA